MKPRQIFILLSILIPLLIGVLYFTIWKPAIWFLLLFGPLILVGLYDMFQKKHAIKRNFPLIGNLRFILEFFRPEIMQYFVETDTEGRPINRIYRSLVYERAKKVNDTAPFGTEMDVYADNYEWMPHSIYAKNFDELDEKPKITVGGPECKKPYEASVLNISAMSFGALSKNAVMAMNKGAKIGGFAQNTGEGGLSPHHQIHGGDLIWQIGTGYFGCRTADGKFDPNLFCEKAVDEQVKMIEIKLSQGAKPGHGGILPASKNTEEIAKIRLVKPHTDVKSPPAHTAFNSPQGLLDFVQQLRDLSGGKPIGFKLCVGQKSEFIDICKAMKQSSIKPDFITVDGGEGGTGAAPVEFSNSLGMPLFDGLSFVYDALHAYDLKKDIKLIASGKIISGFDMIRVMALGADMCNSARAMMMATGCIQALECNKNTCPTGVATQDKQLMKGLVVEDKSVKVANYHEETIKSFKELIAAAGLSKHEELNRSFIFRRIDHKTILKYDQIYPYKTIEDLNKASA